MHRCRPYRAMNPLTGILAPRGDALGYRSASPNGDGRRGNQHFGARHVSAATPPQCDGATTTLLSPHYTLHSSHTFSAKEKDSETGFSVTSLRSVSSSSLSKGQTSLSLHSLIRRFGSRYYSSDLSIWLSVDPMSDKYPSLSPYVYCADNPVKLVDPNGEEWEVNESGYVRQVGDMNDNTLYAVKGTDELSFGERKTKEDGTLISMMADENIMNTMTSKGDNFTGFIAQDNRDKMIETFNFMADNTNVEWAMIGDHTEVGTNTIQTDFLYTSHDNIQCDAFFDRVVSYGKENRLDYHRHSHPKQYTGDDIRYALLYPITSHYTSSNDRNLRDAASPSNYVSVRPDFILRNNGYDIHY